jgi:hypothetical protein
MAETAIMIVTVAVAVTTIVAVAVTTIVAVAATVSFRTSIASPATSGAIIALKARAEKSA